MILSLKVYILTSTGDYYSILTLAVFINGQLVRKEAFMNGLHH